LYEVCAISTVFALTSGTGLPIAAATSIVVRVGAGPLNVHNVIDTDRQIVRYKVILDRRIGFNTTSFFYRLAADCFKALYLL
jgi:hypothetical protein